MVEAFIGSEDELQKIYAHAIKNKYRFYSFGDAMLIV
jgi:S-adenosylmethionine:tRNA-ribosyltransferase-isomerase (queuine synthetase)